MATDLFRRRRRRIRTHLRRQQQQHPDGGRPRTIADRSRIRPLLSVGRGGISDGPRRRRHLQHLAPVRLQDLYSTPKVADGPRDEGDQEADWAAWRHMISGRYRMDTAGSKRTMAALVGSQEHMAMYGRHSTTPL
ncbi:uncharacterized protein LOC119278734 [Triticum dicoccoides]|uniref:uncharacterized protein LOC119278734 n=1 Tax=Triticum dicoccoides TaxID=85692 RepID=UPI00188F6E5D|nr:uncharacterized protein LOC119278734 [Triticum dicoccoides]XP_044352110.1 uncharacterized protein LOC123072595 [Triticum aestivum]